MPPEIITRQELLESEKRILSITRRIIAEALRKPNAHSWLTAKEVQTLLRISPKKLQRLRRKGVLRCSRLGGTPYYDYQHIWRQRKKINGRQQKRQAAKPSSTKKA